MPECGVCKTGIPKYKCPACRLPYCSLQCFKVHKGSPCCKKEEEVSVPPPVVQPARDFESDPESGKRLRKLQLEAVAKSLDVKKMLQDKEIQDMIRKIDNSTSAEQALDTAMSVPAFKELADTLLGLLQAKSS